MTALSTLLTPTRQFVRGATIAHTPMSRAERRRFAAKANIGEVHLVELTKTQLAKILDVSEGEILAEVRMLHAKTDVAAAMAKIKYAIEWLKKTQQVAAAS
jgi:hypothetical protein